MNIKNLFIMLFFVSGCSIDSVAHRSDNSNYAILVDDSTVYQSQSPLIVQTEFLPSYTGGGVSGVITEILVTGDYAYCNLSLKSGKTLWVAVPGTVEIQPGDTASFKSGKEMGQFTSKTLARSFKQMYFSAGIESVKKKTVTPEQRHRIPSSQNSVNITKTDTPKKIIIQTEIQPVEMIPNENYNKRLADSRAINEASPPVREQPAYLSSKNKIDSIINKSPVSPVVSYHDDPKVIGIGNITNLIDNTSESFNMYNYLKTYSNSSHSARLNPIFIDSPVETLYAITGSIDGSIRSKVKQDTFKVSYNYEYVINIWVKGKKVDVINDTCEGTFDDGQKEFRYNMRFSSINDCYNKIRLALSKYLN